MVPFYQDSQTLLPTPTGISSMPFLKRRNDFHSSNYLLGQLPLCRSCYCNPNCRCRPSYCVGFSLRVITSCYQESWTLLVYDFNSVAHREQNHEDLASKNLQPPCQWWMTHTTIIGDFVSFGKSKMPLDGLDVLSFRWRKNNHPKVPPNGKRSSVSKARS